VRTHSVAHGRRSYNGLTSIGSGERAWEVARNDWTSTCDVAEDWRRAQFSQPPDARPRRGGKKEIPKIPKIPKIPQEVPEAAVARAPALSLFRQGGAGSNLVSARRPTATGLPTPKCPDARTRHAEQTRAEQSRATLAAPSLCSSIRRPGTCSDSAPRRSVGQSAQLMGRSSSMRAGVRTCVPSVALRPKKQPRAASRTASHRIATID
jgi:hypothetical protein